MDRITSIREIIFNASDGIRQETHTLYGSQISYVAGCDDINIQFVNANNVVSPPVKMYPGMTIEVEFSKIIFNSSTVKGVNKFLIATRPTKIILPNRVPSRKFTEIVKICTLATTEYSIPIYIDSETTVNSMTVSATGAALFISFSSGLILDSSGKQQVSNNGRIQFTDVHLGGTLYMYSGTAGATCQILLGGY